MFFKLKKLELSVILEFLTDKFSKTTQELFKKLKALAFETEEN